MTHAQLRGTSQSQWGPASDPVTGTVVVVAKYDEDTSWLPQQPHPYVVITKDKSLGNVRHNVMINKGQEGDNYIKFILDNYDDLPPRMIFVQPHLEAWHNPKVRPAVFAVRWLTLLIAQRWLFAITSVPSSGCSRFVPDVALNGCVGPGWLVWHCSRA